MSRIRKIQSHYQPLIRESQEHYEILDWASPDSQRLRFDALCRHVDLNGKSLLDVGCGLGDLVTFLQTTGLSVDYTGVDVVAEMLDHAREHHPNRNFVQWDIFSQPAKATLDKLHNGRPFDVVYCSGTLNLNLGNNMEFLPTALRSMYDLSGETLVVNLLSNRGVETDPTYFNYSAPGVLTVAESIFPKSNLTLVNDYLHNDFTLICQRPNC